jgi:hypothetical protein
MILSQGLNPHEAALNRLKMSSSLGVNPLALLPHHSTNLSFELSHVKTVVFSHDLLKLLGFKLEVMVR